MTISLNKQRKMKENSIVINQALEALKASLPVDDVVTLMASIRSCLSRDMSHHGWRQNWQIKTSTILIVQATALSDIRKGEK